jgi:sialidase-1
MGSTHRMGLLWIALVAACGGIDPDAELEATASDEAAARAVTVVPERSTPFVSGRGYPYYRQPAIVRARNGDLVAFAQGRSRESDDSDIDIVVRRSSDEGRTWSKQKTIVGRDTRDPAKLASPVVLKDGTILLLYLTNRYVEREDERGCRRVWKTVSRDHGKSWSRPEDITRQAQRPCEEGRAGRWIDPPRRGRWGWTGLGPVHGIVKQKGPHAGRIVFAARHVAEDSRTYSHILYSDDDGASWEIGGVVPLRSTEATVVELSGGELLLSARSHGSTNHRVMAISRDGGGRFDRAWVERQLPEPGGCQASLLQHSTNRETGEKNLLFSNPASTTERTRGTLRRSPDDGETWTHAVRYARDGHFSAYSDLVKLSGGDVGVLFEHGRTLRDKHAEIRFSVVPREKLGL